MVGLFFTLGAAAGFLALVADLGLAAFFSLAAFLGFSACSQQACAHGQEESARMEGMNMPPAAQCPPSYSGQPHMVPPSSLFFSSLLPQRTCASPSTPHRPAFPRPLPGPGRQVPLVQALGRVRHPSSQPAEPHQRERYCLLSHPRPSLAPLAQQPQIPGHGSCRCRRDSRSALKVAQPPAPWAWEWPSSWASPRPPSWPPAQQPDAESAQGGRALRAPPRLGVRCNCLACP